MDTSETYIKMCEKAEEIQALWNPEPFNVSKENKWLGDVYLHHYVDNWGEESYPYDAIEIYFAQAIDRTTVIWLPRQDQLQEMLSQPIQTENPNVTIITYGDKMRGIQIDITIGNLVEFMNFRYGGYDKHGQFQHESPTALFPSMEQLWLAFVMKEKYNKVWNGEEWINDTTSRH